MAVYKLILGNYSFQVTDEGSGPPILMLHGFPDSARLWRYQIPALVGAGYRVIAPDQRGFGGSDKPQEIEAYGIAEVLGDVVALLDYLELERVGLVSHDWGAAVGWSLAAIYPERVEKHAALSVGHMTALWNAGIAQRRLAWYMLVFMRQGLAEDIITRQNWQFFSDLWGHHPELEHWIRDLSRPGALTAALNWYRANMDLDSWTEEGWQMPRISVPTMGIWSSGDMYLTESQMLGSGEFMDAPWRYERLEGATHWLMLDRPDSVNALLLDFLGADS
ncbi:MAG: alpha/beta hydrolase [Halieaceae bacterium]|jgi:pimeloyl-ACP methyl ester carboxylesterase|uniref:alpha/beta fold hydrolase n=1 Tax=Haliea alexandrii TaxID=2448162 RepID=UPI000F0B8988|nr:alpha/beta hydrolase [Haliea alexandrii]MCR9185887.1 alpha/beta hydrolase [Halieaceae bacterium]|tara:strand:- start:551 stop:1381 length:831 start_codon:yes stop_codon:yes gene_type:complete